jgi:hypothetical protein
MAEDASEQFKAAVDLIASRFSVIKSEYNRDIAASATEIVSSGSDSFAGAIDSFVSQLDAYVGRSTNAGDVLWWLIEPEIAHFDHCGWQTYCRVAVVRELEN